MLDKNLLISGPYDEQHWHCMIEGTIMIKNMQNIKIKEKSVSDITCYLGCPK